jgi:hypothetical protein
VKCSANSFIVFNNFPVTIYWVFGLSAPIVNNTFPHLKPENGKRHNEESVKYQNVTKLTHGQKQRIDKHFHTWNRRQTP